MQRTQIDFLNHGLLPFVGRADEVERIRRFWSETADAPGLRAMMVIGEAGIGKSRLIEETGPMIAGEGGTMVQAKLYPDASTSLAPLLARALARSVTAQQLLKSEPEGNVGSVTAALVRVCGLRPTLLVIEDLHLITGTSLHDFASLLDRLADEPLSVLCTMRPVEAPARGVLERYLVDEIELSGLSGEEIGRLCHTVFGERMDEEIVAVLREKTTGNSLALRSALRAALRPMPGGGSRRTTTGPAALLDSGAFVKALERNVRLLSEGMVAHLTEREKDGAEALAMLGEVFARESATEVLENAEAMLEILTFKGIITVSPTPPPPMMRTHSAHPPLVFTHSLLHRHFVDRGRFPADDVIRILAAGLPVYSLLPILALRDHATTITADGLTVRHATRRIFSMISALGNTRSWTDAPRVLTAAEAIVAAGRESWEEEDRREMDAVLLINQLAVQRRARDSDYPARVEQLLALTENPTANRWAELRMRALVFHRRLFKRTDPHRSLALRAEVEELIERFPEQRYGRPYVSHLRESVETALALNDNDVRREVERSLQRLNDDPATTDDIRLHAWRVISPNLVTLFTTPEELQARLQLMAELEAAADPDASPVVVWRIALLFDIGAFDRARETAAASIGLLRDLGLHNELLSLHAIEAFIETITTGDAAAIMRHVPELMAEAPVLLKAQIGDFFAAHFATALLLLEEIPTAIEMVAAVGSRVASLRQHQRVLIALATDSRADLETAQVEAGGETDADDRNFGVLIGLLLSGSEDTAGAMTAARELLAAHLLTTHNLAQKRAAVDLVLAIDEAHDARLASGLEKEIRSAVATMLAWTDERRIHTVMRKLIDRYERWLGKTEARTWRSAAAAIGRERDEQRATDGIEQRTQVSLFGAITIQRPDTPDPVRVRGTQLCALLGLMAADRMLARPLSSNEFASIVFGAERDPDSVRKSMNFAVFRLRELLGSEAISTTGETPALNPELVEIDLVIAHMHLKAAGGAMREGALVRALPELIAALRLSGGQVPFPTLYDEFFEAAREDFESEIRHTTIRLARALNREGDNGAAEEVLRLAFAAMPDDEEIAELLQETLIALGKRAEAKRIGMRLEMADA